MFSHAGLRFLKTVLLGLFRLLDGRRTDRTRRRALDSRVATGANRVDNSSGFRGSGTSRPLMRLFFCPSVIKGLFVLGYELGSCAVNIVELFAADSNNRSEPTTQVGPSGIHL